MTRERDGDNKPDLVWSLSGQASGQTGEIKALTQGCFNVKVKVQVYNLISSLKTYRPNLHLTPWTLDLFIRVPFQLHGEHTVLQPFRRIKLIIHIAISVLPGTHFLMKHLRVKCLDQGHNMLTMSQD